MSDNVNENLSKNEQRSNDKDDNVCRDFVRGACDRKFCKFKHESDSKMLNFCHDFQNNICPRQLCKFIHCSPEEEAQFKEFGIMSTHIVAEATRKNQLPGTPPICNQFRKGLCRRSTCKYRHLTMDEENAEILEILEFQSKKSSIPAGHPRRGGILYHSYEDEEMVVPKKRFRQQPQPDSDDLIIDCDRHDVVGRTVGQRFNGYFAGNPPPAILRRIDSRTLMLAEENSLLHKEVSQLKRQVSDLTATNEFLLDQNASLRVSSKQRNEAVTMPAVTLTNTNTPQMIRTVAGSVATVPVSLATVSTCNPVSVSIAGCPSVSMAQPAQLLAPSQQILVTTNTPSQLAIANSSQAQLALAAQQNLANNLAQQAAAAQQPQLTATHQGPPQLTLATTTQQLTLANTAQQLPTQQTHQQQLANQAQAMANQQLQTQQAAAAQQLAQLAANPTQQLTSQPQQLTIANTGQHLTVASVPQQLTLASTSPQLLTQQNITSTQQIEIHRTSQLNAINTSQAIAMSNPTTSMVTYPIVTQQTLNGLTH